MISRGLQSTGKFQSRGGGAATSPKAPVALPAGNYFRADKRRGFGTFLFFLTTQFRNGKFMAEVRNPVRKEK
jgi:hypothetical protein